MLVTDSANEFNVATTIVGKNISGLRKVRVVTGGDDNIDDPKLANLQYYFKKRYS